MNQKIGILVMWLVLLAGMVFGGGGLARASRIVFFAIALVHVVEFFVKRRVMEKAGGSMAQHFLQTLVYGFVHWKPLEEQAGGASEDG